MTYQTLNRIIRHLLRPHLAGALLLALAGRASAGFVVEVPLPPEAPTPSVLTGQAERVALRGLRAMDESFRRVRAANLAEPYYTVQPLAKDAAAKQRVRALAKELGIDPKRVVVTGGDAPVTATAGGASDFIFIHEQVVREAPENVLAFLLAHEWAHITREHSRKVLQLYYWEQVAACLSCVQEQEAKGVTPSRIALNAKQGPIGHKWAVLQRWAELESDIVALQMLKSKGRSVQLDELFDYFLAMGGEPEETADHPSHVERRYVLQLFLNKNL